MANYVATQVTKFENGVSAGAAAAAADLTKLADAGERVDATVTKVGRSAASLKSQLDPVTKASNDLAKAKKTLAEAESRLSDDMVRGRTTQAEYDRAILTATANVEKKRAALAAARQAASELDDIVKRSSADIQAAAQVAERYASSLSDLRSKYDPLYSAERKHAQTLAEISQAEQLGALSAQQAATARTQQTQAYVALQRELSGLAALERQQAAAERDAKTAAAALGAEVDNLRSKYNPLYAASKKYETALAEITRAEELGAISAKQAALARQDATQHLNGLAAANDTAAAASSRLASNVQNASFQVGDFAVQVASGQSWVTALAQQLPQLLGSFGMIGAIAGAGVAIAAVAAKFAGLKSATEEMRKALDDSADGWEHATEQASRFKEAVRSQGDQYLAADAAGRRYREGLRGEIENVVNLTRSYGGLTGAMRAAEQARLDQELYGQRNTESTLRTALSTAGARFSVNSEQQVPTLGAGSSIISSSASMNYTGDPLIAAEAQKVTAALKEMQASSSITTESVGKLFIALHDGAQITGQGGDAFRQLRETLLALMPTLKEYEDTVRRTQIQQRILNGEVIPGAALEQARSLASQIGGRYQTRQAANDNIAKLRAGLAEATDSNDIAAINSALHEQGMVLQGLEPAMTGYLRGLQQQAIVAKTMEGAQRELVQAEVQANETARAAGQGHASAAAIAQARALVQQRLNSQMADYIIRTELVADGDNAAAAAMQNGVRAANQARDAWAAQTEALKYGTAGSAEYMLAVNRITDSLGNQRDATEALNNAKALLSQDQQMEMLRTEATLIGATADQRERELAALREKQKIQGEGGDPDSEAGKRRIQNAKLISDQARTNTQLQNSWDELARVGEQAFDRIGGAITEAFANGSLRAVDFRNIAKAVLSEVLQAALKLAVINPLLNSMFGGTRGTLGGIGTVLSGGTGAAAAGSAATGGGMGGSLDTASGLWKAFGGGSSGAVSTGWTWLDNGLNATAYSYGGGEIATQLGEFADTGMTLGGASGATTAATNVSWAQAAGGAAGILGGAYGLYSGIQTGGARGWAQGIGGTAGMVAGGTALAGGSAAVASGAAAAGLGAGASAALGAIAAAAPYVAVIAAIAAMLLPGQKPSDMTGAYTANLHTGETVVGGLTGDRFSQDNRDLASSIGSQVNSLADSLKNALGVGEIPFSYWIQAGNRDGIQAHYDGVDHNYERNDAQAAQLVQDMAQSLINSMKGLASTEVQAIIANSSGVDATLQNLDWYNGDYKNMIAESVQPTAAFVKQVNALAAPIDAAIAKARELGIKEDALNAVRAKAVQVMLDQRTATLDAITANDSQRQALASGVSELVLQIQNFSAAAQAEVRALDDQLRDLDIQPETRASFTADRWRTLDAEYYALVRRRDAASTASSNSLWDRFQAASGNGATLEGALWDQERRANAERVAAASDGVTDMALLERTLAEERLAIIRRFNDEAADLEKQRNDAATQTATGLVSSLGDFARGLRYGDSSSLDYRSQYDLAVGSFNDVAGRALSGDFGAMSQFQDYATDLLSASRAVNGSGARYAADMAWVTDLVGQIGNMGADRLTEAARNEAAIEGQTQTLVAALAAVQAEVAALRREQQQQGSAKPERANAA